MKALPLTLAFIALFILAGLAYGRFVFYPVGRYQLVPAGESPVMRLDTVTGRVDRWKGQAGWIELGK